MERKATARRWIVAAAVKHGGKVYTGERHGVIMRQIWDELAAQNPNFLPGDARITQDDQGFVDNNGAFLNRWQAGACAYYAGQTDSRHEHLLSEHLW